MKRLECSSLSLLMASLLGGCAHQAAVDTTAAPAANIHVSAPAQASPASRAMAAVLAGELAARRGQLDVAAAALLQAAELNEDARLAERATRLAFAAEDFDLADRATAAWARLAPEDSGAINLRLRARIASGQARLEDFQAWLANQGDSPEAEQQIAALIGAASPTIEQGLQWLAELESVRGSAGLAYALGTLALREQATDVALAALQRARERGWPARACDELLLRIHLVRGAEREAEVVLGGLQRELRDDRAASLGVGQTLLEAEAWSLAQAHFRWVLKRWPQDPGAELALGLMAVQDGDDAAARTAFLSLWEEGSRRDEAALQLGRLAARSGDWETARLWFARVNQGRRWADATLGHARALAELGQVPAARALLEALRFTDPDRAVSAWQTEAELLERAGQTNDALAVLDRAIDQTESLDLIYRRALMRDAAGDFAAATADLEAILRRDANNPHALNALGYMLADRGVELERARDLIERALEQRPDDPAIRDSLGWVLFRQGQHEQALRELRVAYAAYPDAEIAAHLGEVLWTLGEREAARAVWAQALEQAPDNLTLQATWKRFTQQ